MTSFTNKNVLNLLRNLPRLTISNLRNNDGAVKKNKRGRAQHGGDKHGHGNKGSKARQNFMRPGYETGNTPFYMKFPREQYYRDHNVKRQYPPLSLYNLQKMIDLDRLDITKPIDLSALCNTGLYKINPEDKHFGVNLIDEGADVFKAKINIEVQWANEPTIAAIEKNGGVITTSFFDINSLFILINPKKFFQRGEAIPRRMIPPEDSILYYSSAANRGYLADPEKISWERFVLAQKYGYILPKIEDDPDYEMLVTKKDQRQIFYGLEPGWVVNLKDKLILKPIDSQLKEFYRS